MNPPTDLSFLCPPGEVADWRMVVLTDAALDNGVLATLPGTVDDLAESLDLDTHGLRVVLDALAGWGVVERGADGRYDRGPQAPEADAAVTIRHHARALRRWATAVEDRLRGVPLETDSPGTLHPDLFLDALGVTARQAAPAIVDRCVARFPGARSVLDLGGLHGEYSLEFSRRGLRATMQDLPRIIDVVERRGHLADTDIELYAGSFFEAVPEGPFDLAFCCGITHTFDGEHNVALFQNLRKVVAPGGGIAVITFFRHLNPVADVFAVQMLANASGGDTHAEDEYRTWLTDAGFEVDEALVEIPGRPQSIMFATAAE